MGVLGTEGLQWGDTQAPFLPAAGSQGPLTCEGCAPAARPRLPERRLPVASSEDAVQTDQADVI